MTGAFAAGQRVAKACRCIECCRGGADKARYIGFFRKGDGIVIVFGWRANVSDVACVLTGHCAIRTILNRAAGCVFRYAVVLKQLNYRGRFAVIFHIASQADIDACNTGKFYRCASLQSEGFIHCCKADQLAGVVERYYADVPDLLVLTIDPDQLSAELVYENTVGGDELFPHIYGEINMDSVTDISPLSAFP